MLETLGLLYVAISMYFVHRTLVEIGKRTIDGQFLAGLAMCTVWPIIIVAAIIEMSRYRRR